MVGHYFVLLVAGLPETVTHRCCCCSMETHCRWTLEKVFLSYCLVRHSHASEFSVGSIFLHVDPNRQDCCRYYLALATLLSAASIPVRHYYHSLCCCYEIAGWLLLSGSRLLYFCYLLTQPIVIQNIWIYNWFYEN
jgi:hypothetical protein